MKIPLKMAERVGFEPTVELPLRRFSRPELSTAQSPLQAGKDKRIQRLLESATVEIREQNRPVFVK